MEEVGGERLKRNASPKEPKEPNRIHRFYADGTILRKAKTTIYKPTGSIHNTST